MFDLLIESSTGAYPVTIGQGTLGRLFDSNVIVIADTRLSQMTNSFRSRVLFVEANEELKTLSTCEKLILELKATGCNRDTLLVGIGGGFLQDIVTLVASVYMRGIRWIFVPTTLMAMMDSCVGGKSSINVGETKNLIGNFYPPKEILIDVEFLPSLNGYAIASGLSEGVKICFARGGSDFETFRILRKRVESYDSATGAELIAHVLNAKKWFIESDEFDMGPRKLLNFGHTFGHALESATSFDIPHGVAICLGVIAALKHPASILGDLEGKLLEECLEILAPIRRELALDIEQFDSIKFQKAFQGDKKHSETHFRLVLPIDGKLHIVEVLKNDEALDNALKAMRSAFILVIAQ